MRLMYESGCGKWCYLFYCLLQLNTFLFSRLLGKNPAVRTSFCVGIFPPMIALESCSNPQKIRQVFVSTANARGSSGAQECASSRKFLF